LSYQRSGQCTHPSSRWNLCRRDPVVVSCFHDNARCLFVNSKLDHWIYKPSLSFVIRYSVVVFAFTSVTPG
jgi:hypothetical protein